VIATGISVNGGIGVSVGPPAEMHTYRTQTGVVSLNTNIFDGFWKGIYGKDIEYPNWEGHKVRPGWFEKKGF
jgi:hypothetical protein